MVNFIEGDEQASFQAFNRHDTCHLQVQKALLGSKINVSAGSIAWQVGWCRGDKPHAEEKQRDVRRQLCRRYARQPGSKALLVKNGQPFMDSIKEGRDVRVLLRLGGSYENGGKRMGPRIGRRDVDAVLLEDVSVNEIDSWEFYRRHPWLASLLGPAQTVGREEAGSWG